MPATVYLAIAALFSILGILTEDLNLAAAFFSIVVLFSFISVCIAGAELLDRWMESREDRKLEEAIARAIQEEMDAGWIYETDHRESR